MTVEPAGSGHTAAGSGAREPWIAANLSLFAPGLGEIYAGRIVTGICYMALQVATFAACVVMNSTALSSCD